MKKVLVPQFCPYPITQNHLLYIKAPSMITSNINNTKAKAAPPTPVLFPHPVLHPHPVFINIPPFLYLHFIVWNNLGFVYAIYLYFKFLFVIIVRVRRTYEEKNTISNMCYVINYRL